MARGDSTRAWFPEMVDDLLAAWSPSMSWEALGTLCVVLTEKRKVVRKARGIKDAIVGRCPCGGNRVMVPHDITIRSALYALRKADRITEEKRDKFDRSWKSYQRKNGLSGQARKKEKAPKPSACAHARTGTPA